MFTFFQYIIEVVDVKPTVEHQHKEMKTLIGHLHVHKFYVKHPALKRKMHIGVIHKHGDSHGTVLVGSKGKNDTTTSFKTIGHLGTRNMMHVLGRVKHHLPHVETLGGDRVTGSREDTGKHNTNVSIKHVKPIPPEKQ